MKSRSFKAIISFVHNKIQNKHVPKIQFAMSSERFYPKLNFRLWRTNKRHQNLFRILFLSIANVTKILVLQLTFNNF